MVSHTGDLVILLTQTNPNQRFSANSVGQALRRLERRQLLIKKLAGDYTSYALTTAGERELVRMSLADLALPPQPLAWDGLWRIVLFSIPESKLRERTAFRQALVRLGFAPLQRSAWVYPFDCQVTVNELAIRLNIESLVTIVVAESITPDTEIRQQFHLPNTPRAGISSPAPFIPLTVDQDVGELLPIDEID